MFTIALSGQLDRLASKFVNWIAHRKTHPYQIIGVGHTPYLGIHHLGWRTGSLMSQKDTAGMLEGVDALVVFCMTPPKQTRTSEGLAVDVALASAVNLAKIAQSHPGMRVILVMRRLPKEADEQMPIYDYWLEVRKIFQERCPNICVLQCDPILNECDAITLAVFERLCTIKHPVKDVTDNRVRPASMHQFFEAIERALHSVDASCQVYGDGSVSWREWFETASNAISIGHKLRYVHQIYSILKTEGQQRERLLNESLGIQDDLEDAAAHSDVLKRICHFTADMIEEGVPGALALEPDKSHAVKHTCYVQRLVAQSRRSVSETTDLFMQWLPRYFRRAVRVDELGTGRLACRLGFVPLLEFEKIVESESRCRMNVRFPWGRNVQTPTSFVLMSTGLGDDLRKLLIIVEDAPDSNALITGIRGMMMAFGLYLKEYG